jgi:ATP-dependent DNA helicase RecQ
LTTIQQVLKKYWNFDSFRPLQQEIIEAVLLKKDVLALLPAAAGKSLCYQVPALSMPGLCLVISPLIALMKDQVEQLRRKNITALAIYSGMGRRELEQTLQVAAESNCKFLYISPERIETGLFQDWLPALDIRLIAVDEAHCISQWGYDFRPAYLRIAELRTVLSQIPLIAVTASATSGVQEDICEKLLLREVRIFRQSFARPNLSYRCQVAEDKIGQIRSLVNPGEGSGIIYCRSRKRTLEISRELDLMGISSAAYHAGMDRDQRVRIQDDWIRDKLRFIVSTSAFGMGIDKPGVRLVIHADAPDCLESYYQEAGRAGRDGKKAGAILLYNNWEIGRLEQSSAIRFPGLEEIRAIYGSLMNYLQIPAGSGGGMSYDFDLGNFIQRFGLGTWQATYAIRILEQEGLLSYLEWVHSPSKVYFSMERSLLPDYEKQDPGRQPLITHLMRSYPGIFDQPVPFAERSVASALGRDREGLLKDLGFLQAAGIIQYHPANDKPQLHFLHDRPRTGDLVINVQSFQKRKEQYERGIGSMLAYIRLEHACRSRFIAGYFGEENAGPCGVCDNCLAAVT